MRTDDGQDPLIEPSQPQRRPGAELARAREAAGIGLRAMADTLHLPEKQLRALESDDYANLPPPTFVRGYLRSYARALGLDADEIVGLYEALEVGAEEPGLRLASGHDNGAHNRGLALAIAVLALAVALSLGAWWWQTRMAEPADGDGNAAPPPAEEAAEAGSGMSGDDTAAADGNIDAASSGPGDADDDQGEAAATAAMSGSSAESELRSMRSQEGGGNGDAQAQSGPGSTADETATDDADSPSTVAADGSATAEMEEPSSPTASGSAATSGTDENTGGELAAPEDSADFASGSDGDVAAEDSTVALTESGDDGPDGAGSGVSITSSAAEEGGYQPPSQTASADAAIAPEANEGPEQLEVNVDGRSWIEIYDARGRELVYTLYTGSAPLRLRGWAPFDVFLGNSPDVSIRFNGDAIDKAGFTRSDRTARFLVDASGANRR